MAPAHVKACTVRLAVCGYNHTTTRRTVPAYTNCDIQLQNVAPDDGLKSPGDVEQLMINKDTIRICAASWSTYIHIAMRCTVHSMSDYLCFPCSCLDRKNRSTSVGFVGIHRKHFESYASEHRS